MLVQKSGLSKRTKILLIIFVALMVPGAYFIYSYFSPKAQSSTTVQPGVEHKLAQPTVVTPLNDATLNNPQLETFTEQSVNGFSEQHAGVYLDEHVPIPPAQIKVSDPRTGGKLTVSWVVPATINFKTVKVFRSAVAGQKGDEVYSSPVGSANALMVFADSELTNNRTYYYYVVMVNEQGDASQNTDQYQGVPTDTFPPGAPINVTVQKLTDERMKVSWMPPADPDYGTAHVYRSQQSGVLGELLNLEIKTGDKDTQYVEDTVTTNVTYYYTVTSVDTSGNESSTDVLGAPYRANPFVPAS